MSRCEAKKGNEKKSIVFVASDALRCTREGERPQLTHPLDAVRRCGGCVVRRERGSLLSLTLNLSLRGSSAMPMDVAEDVQLETVPDMLMRCVYGVVWALQKKNNFLTANGICTFHKT